MENTIKLEKEMVFRSILGEIKHLMKDDDISISEMLKATKKRCEQYIISDF